MVVVGVVLEVADTVVMLVEVMVDETETVELIIRSSVT